MHGDTIMSTESFSFRFTSYSMQFALLFSVFLRLFQLTLRGIERNQISSAERLLFGDYNYFCNPGYSIYN